MPDFFDKFTTRGGFEDMLSKGRINIGAIPHSVAKLVDCPDCGEKVFRIIRKGEAMFIQTTAYAWTLHQCPPQHYELGPEEGQDEPQRDGDGELV